MQDQPSDPGQPPDPGSIGEPRVLDAHTVAVNLTSLGGFYYLVGGHLPPDARAKPSCLASFTKADLLLINNVGIRSYNLSTAMYCFKQLMASNHLCDLGISQACWSCIVRASLVEYKCKGIQHTCLVVCTKMPFVPYHMWQDPWDISHTLSLHLQANQR